MRINPLQTGFSIIVGWTIVFVSWSVSQSIINLGGIELFWVLLILGLTLIGLGLIKKEKIISTKRSKILLQIGAVVIAIWIMFLLQMEGPYDLGLPKIYIPTGYTPDGVPIVTLLALIIFLALPFLGLILLVLGIALNRMKKRLNFYPTQAI